MLRTSLQALSKVFPTVNFFKNTQVQNEIKETMLTLFRERLEQGVADMYGTYESQAQAQDKKVQDVEIGEATNFLGYIQAQKTSSLTGASQSNQASFMNTSFSTDISGEDDSNR